MSEFTASNGMKFDADGFGRLTYTCSAIDGSHSITPNEVNGLREFFQKENDDRLGRWRWPENPDYIVYPKGDGLVEVLLEPTSLVLASTVLGNAPFSDEHAQAARSYFAAHPEPKPAWHDAKPGEFWEVTHSGTTEVVRVDGAEAPRFVSVQPHSLLVSVPIIAPSITGARRIWPEVAS